jgi:death-on-curing protein
MIELTLDHIEHVSHVLAQVTMNWNEPIPGFTSRFQGKLESCLKTPFQAFGGTDFYPTLEDKAAILFYLMVKNHPFQNGNKRIAVTSLYVFLALNGRWMTLSKDDLYELAMFVAGSPAKWKDAVVMGVRNLIRKHKVPFA